MIECYRRDRRRFCCWKNKKTKISFFFFLKKRGTETKRLASEVDHSNKLLSNSYLFCKLFRLTQSINILQAMSFLKTFCVFRQQKNSIEINAKQLKKKVENLPIQK
jgi:hypothetical protein